MIILFEKDEQQFETLGLGVLKDASECIITEELNGSFELEMIYPITGYKFNEIKLQRIILAKPNMYDRSQPFRIYSITKPINGRVTISAEHISYDASGYIVKPFFAETSYDAFEKIQNNAFPESPFKLSTDKYVLTSMQTDKPYSQRALLAGQSGSLLDIYGGEFKFDRFNISLLNNRGKDRNVNIRYGKNLTDLEDSISSQKMYTGIFPFYSATINEMKTLTEKYYQGVYIVPETVPFAGNWLSLSDGGKSLIPLIENTPVQIKTEGLYYDKICYFKRVVPNETLFDCYIRESEEPYSYNWLSLTENGSSIVPAQKTIYKIVSEGDLLYKTFLWDGSNYISYTGTGFYFVYPEEDIPEPPLTRIATETEEKLVYLDLINDSELQNGIIYVEGQETTRPEKILNLDLTDNFGEVPTEEELKGKAIDYLKNNNLQDINNSLTLSFIKLSDTETYKHLKEIERIELGDYINVYHEKLGVNSKLQVIVTTYNVLSEKYEEIELGKKSATLTDSVITSGDSVSSLTNDAKYTDQISVVNLITENVTANYITGKNASLTQAQIEQLKTERIEVRGLIEASEAYIDTLMAQLLTAENAEVKSKLTAGEIEVKGKIIATSGEIGGCVIKDGKLLISTSIAIGKNDNDGYNFTVDSDGNVKANSVEITGGEIYLGQYNEQTGYPFSVDRAGNIMAKSLNFHQSGIVEGKDVSTTISNGRLSVSDLFFTDSIKLTSKSAPDSRFHNVVVMASLITKYEIPGIVWYIQLVLTTENAKGEIVPDTTFNDINIVLKYYWHNVMSGSMTVHTQIASIPRGVYCGPTGYIHDYALMEHINEPIGSSWRPSLITYGPTLFPEFFGEVGELTLNCDFIPSMDYSFDLGEPQYRWNDIFATNTVIQTSDKNQKKEINYDISKYEKVFDKLKPVSYKFIENSSERTHLGLIAQDLEIALEESDLTSKDFAGLIKSPKDKNKTENLTNEDYVYGLRYSELHAMEINEIQKLKKEIQELKEKNNKKEE